MDKAMAASHCRVWATVSTREEYDELKLKNSKDYPHVGFRLIDTLRMGLITLLASGCAAAALVRETTACSSPAGTSRPSDAGHDGELFPWGTGVGSKGEIRQWKD